jgi:YD repeat-containing protein
MTSAYAGNQTSLAPAAHINDRVKTITDSGGQTNGLEFTEARTGAKELYDHSGRLQTVTARNGQVTRYTYSDSVTPKEIAPGIGYLLSITDAFGQQLQFAYDSKGNLVLMKDPAGTLYMYNFDSLGRLASVEYPDGRKRTYIYGESAYTAGKQFPFLLTGIVDGLGVRYATFAYTESGAALSTEHAGGVQKYRSQATNSATRTVTDPLGTARAYTFISRSGRQDLFSISQPGPGGSGVRYAYINRDANGNFQSYQDFDGQLTKYVYDLSRNLESIRTEGADTPAQRIIRTEWHPTFTLPARIAEPNRITSFSYDNNGNLLEESIQATTDANGSAGFSATPIGSPRIRRYTYNQFGLRLTATGPRTDVNSTTNYTYDTSGNLTAVTSPLGHTTSYSEYDAHGRVGRVTDPNGLATSFVYTPRGWLSSYTMGGETTTYDYDAAGLLKTVQLPDGSTLSYAYDPAHRLIQISDSAGNRVAFTLDNMGNRISEQTYDVSGNLTRQIARMYDPLNLLKQVTGAVQ